MSDVAQYISVLNERREFLKEQRAWLEGEAEAYDRDIERLDALRQRTRKELAAYLLADVEDDDLQDLQQRLRYPSLIPIKRAYEAELEQAQAQLLELQAHEDAQHLELNLSQVQDELEELRPAYEPLREVDNTWRANRYLLELEARGYFQSNYEPGFFGRFRDWRCISLLMEDLEESLGLAFEDPDALREAYLRHRADADSVFEAWEYVRKRAAALTELQQTLTALQHAPQNLFAAMYEALSTAVIDHLESCDQDLRVQIAAKDVHLATFLTKAAGLEKQVQYLRELKTTRVKARLDDINQQVAKIGRKVNKARRKPTAIAASDIRGSAATRKALAQKRHKWDKRCAKMRHVRTRVSGFSKYQKGSFTDDYLWWDAMSGGAAADDLYEVRQFRREHPHFDHRTYVAVWMTDPHHHHADARHAVDVAAEAMAEAMVAENLDLDTDIS